MTTKIETRRFAYHVDYYHYSNTYPHNPDTHLVYDRTLNGDGMVTYGSNYKDWRVRIRRGLSATTALEATSTLNIQMTPGQVTRGYTAQGWTTWLLTGDLFARAAFVPVPSSVMDAVAEQRAASKFLSHYIDHKNTWRGGNFFAELRETIHALRHPVQSFYRQTWDLAGKVREIGRIYTKRREYAKHIGDAWLAYAFGVKPLIADANDAAKALNRVKEQLGGTGHTQKRISGFGRNQTHSVTRDVDLGSVVAGGTGLQCSYDRYLITTNTVRYHGAISARLEDSTTLLEQFGVGAFDVLPAVWEAIPWSFAIDYFANVGEMIDSCRLASGDMLWVNRTVRNTAALTMNGLRCRPIAFQFGSVGGSPKFYALGRYVIRGASSVPYPSFHFKVPGIASNAWLNIAALSTQIARSKPTGARLYKNL